MLSLTIAETKRAWLLFLRYPGEAIAVFLILTLLFAGLFFGASYLAGPDHEFGGRIDAAVVSYVAWLLVMGIFSGIGGEIEQEAKTGTLEQVVLSKRSLLFVSIVRSLANLAINVLITLAIFGGIIWMTGADIAMRPQALPSVALLIIGAMGLGLMMGSVTLLMKKTAALIGITQIGLLFLILYQPETTSAGFSFPFDALPLVGSASLLREMLTQGQALVWQDHTIPALNAAAYFLLGCILFLMAFRKTSRDGSLGHY